MQPHKTATVTRSAWPYEWVEESAEVQWCYDRRDPKSTKLGEWKLKTWEQPGPYRCRVGAGPEWGEASAASAREAILKEIDRQQRQAL